MKNQLFLLSSLLFIIVLLGLLTLRGDVLALALPLMAYLGAALWFAPEKIDLQIERKLSKDWVTENKPVNVSLRLKNCGATVDELLIQDHLPPGAQLLEGETATFISLPAGETYELTYTIHPNRGEHRWEPVRCLAGEMFALFGREFEFDTKKLLRARPKISSLGSIPIRPPQTRGFSGPIPARQAGSGVDFFSVREYQAGDPQRRINWKIAARHPFNLFTNVQQAERVADVGIILDSRITLNVFAHGDSLFEHSARAAAALSISFLNDGNRVALLVYGGSIQSVFPGYGKVQQRRILNALARARLGRNYALENLAYLPTRFFPTRSQIILLSPIQPEDIPVLIQLRALGYAVMLICPDPIDFELHSETHSKTKENLAYRLAYTERAFILQQVRRIGVQIVDWRVHEPLEPALQQTMRSQPIRHHLRG